jgi:hypothetical protein
VKLCSKVRLCLDKLVLKCIMFQMEIIIKKSYHRIKYTPIVSVQPSGEGEKTSAFSALYFRDWQPFPSPSVRSTKRGERTEKRGQPGDGNGDGGAATRGEASPLPTRPHPLTAEHVCCGRALQRRSPTVRR